MRKAGLLAAISSLPLGHGIGDFGESSLYFIDFLRRTKTRIWQILPLHPLGFGNSPYQPYSSYALDEIYISLDALQQQGYILTVPQKYNGGMTQYDTVRKYKEPYFKEAFSHFCADAAYSRFILNDWVYPYAVFRMLKQKNGGTCWNTWQAEERTWPLPQDVVQPYAKEIQYQMFLQFIAHTQWQKVLDAAHAADVEIMGDIPIYAGLDSSDCWVNRACFLLDDAYQPTFVAGVPPDYFSESGQRWGNPLYDWEYMEQDGFSFWVSRLRYAMQLYDIVRIDHFRAFDTYWKIQADCETAIEGEWAQAPGYALFDTLFAQLPHCHIVAEDLGELREEVHMLRDFYGIAGMRVIQFSYDAENTDVDERCDVVVYTGTHDNAPIAAWFAGLPAKVQARIDAALPASSAGIAHRFIDYACKTKANSVIIPLQDLLGLHEASRMNFPGTIGAPNWQWRLDSFDALEAEAEYWMHCTQAVNG